MTQESKTGTVINIDCHPKFKWHKGGIFEKTDMPLGCECGAYTFHIVGDIDINKPAVVKCSNCNSIRRSLKVTVEEIEDEPEQKDQPLPVET